MATKIVVPTLGESIVEATVARWFKKSGEAVRVGEPLVELETDKVNLEVGADQAGVLGQIMHQEGEDVRVGDVLGEIQPSAQGAEAPQSAPQQAPASEKTEQKPEQEPASQEAVQQKPEPENKQEPIHENEERVTPLARKMAEMHGINVNEIEGSGQGGRVVRQDVERVLAAPQPAEAVQPVAEEEKTVERRAVPATDNRGEERIRLSRRRRTIAEHLVSALQSTAMLTTFNDVDMTQVMELRGKYKSQFKEKFSASLGITSFFVKASVMALKDFPQVNAELDGDTLVLKKYYDIGIAVGAEEGLVVPVIRDADRLSFAEIEVKIQSFVEKSKGGTLSIEDLTGGTFSITNGGVFGSLLSTPILNYPQVAILGLHRIEDRPIVRDGTIEVHPMMYLALSYDHRVIDGREAVQFLNRIKQVIEHPEMLILEL